MTTATLTVNYRIGDKDGNMIAESYIAEMPVGSKYSVDSPEIKGFVLKDDSQAEVIGTLNNNTTVEVIYDYANQSVGYVVEYVGVDSNGVSTVLATDKTGTAAPGETVTVPSRSFEDYVQRTEDMSLVVTPDGKAKKTVYYEKAEGTVYVLFNTNGSYVAPVAKLPGDDLSDVMDQVVDPTREGYAFDGWDAQLPATMPDHDIILNAKWIPGETSYTVLYWFQNIEDDGYTLNSGLNDTRQDTTGEKVTALPEDIAKADTEVEGDDFYGFEYSHADEVELTADHQTVVNIYYDREIWTVRVFEQGMWDGTTKEEFSQYDRSKPWIVLEGKYGSAISSEEFPSYEQLQEHFKGKSPNADNTVYTGLSMPERENNWTSSGCSPYYFSPSAGFTVQAEPIDGKGTHTIDLFPFYDSGTRVFSISVYLEDLQGAGTDSNSYTKLPEDYRFGGRGTARLHLNCRDGFTFEYGYYRTGYDNPPTGSPLYIDPDNMPADTTLDSISGALEYHVYEFSEVWARRVKNTVQFVSEGDTIGSISDVYYEAPLEGYLTYVPTNDDPTVRFAGWYTDPSLFDIATPVTAMTMPSTGITFYAKWEPIDVTVKFDSHGGSEVASQTVQVGDKAVLPEEPTRAGYEFMGWFTEADAGERWGFDRQVVEDTTLHAHWRKINAGTLTINHVMEGEDVPFATETIQSVQGATVVAEALVPQDTNYPTDSYLKPDFAQQSVMITGDPDKDVVTFTYVPASQRTYTVKYLEQGTNKVLHEPKTVPTLLSFVTEKAIAIDGYTVDHPWIAQAVENGDEITFYYSGPGGGGTETPKITLTPQDMVAYTGGNSLGGDSFPATRYLVKASGGANLSNLKFTVDGKTYTLPEGAKSGDVVVLPWLPDVFTFEDGSELGAADVVEGTSVTNDLAAGDYTISVDKTKVTVSAGTASVAFGTGDLIVRDVSDPEAVIKDEVDIAQPVLNDADSVDTSDGIGVAVVDDATSYYTNGDDELQLLGDTESDEPQISLLFDTLLPGEEREDTAGLLRERAGKDGYELADENSEFRYLDLVNENDGNAWVGTDDGVEIKVYWPVPEDVDPDSVEFSVLHFEDLHRQYRENLDEQIRNCDVVRIDGVSVDESGENVVFTLAGDQDEGCFSPFALTWSPTGDGPSEPDSDEPDTPDTPDTPEDPDTPDEPGEPGEPSEPGEPPEPSEPAKPSKPSRPETTIPQTGDLLGAIVPLVCLAGVGTVCAGAVLNHRRKKR